MINTYLDRTHGNKASRMSALLSVGACVALFFASFIGIHHTITIAQPNLDNKVTITIARPAPAVAEPVAQPTPVIPPPPVPVEQNPVERVVPKESVNPIQEVIPEPVAEAVPEAVEEAVEAAEAVHDMGENLSAEPAQMSSADYDRFLSTFVALVQDKLNYPSNARRAGIEGTVEMRVVFNSAGGVVSYELADEAGAHSMLNKSALATLSKVREVWKAPITPGYEQVILIPIIFEIQ